MGLSSTSYLCICVCAYLCVYLSLSSEHQWIVGVMSFQKTYDLIGLTWWCIKWFKVNFHWLIFGAYGRTDERTDGCTPGGPRGPKKLPLNAILWFYFYLFYCWYINNILYFIVDRSKISFSIFFGNLFWPQLVRPWDLILKKKFWPKQKILN